MLVGAVLIFARLAVLLPKSCFEEPKNARSRSLAKLSQLSLRLQALSETVLAPVL